MQIRVLEDGENLYFGVICDDPDPGSIAVQTLQRDGDMGGDDRIILRWAGSTLDANFLDLKRAGALAGVKDLKQGLGLDVTPFGTSRSSAGFGPQESFLRGVTGVDATYNITQELAGVLTINPEFGETEVDSRQLNLTRFSLFFTEKRQFFTQGSNLFRCGALDAVWQTSTFRHDKNLELAAWADASGGGLPSEQRTLRSRPPSRMN